MITLIVKPPPKLVALKWWLSLSATANFKPPIKIVSLKWWLSSSVSPNLKPPIKIVSLKWWLSSSVSPNLKPPKQVDVAFWWCSSRMLSSRKPPKQVVSPTLVVIIPEASFKQATFCGLIDHAVVFSLRRPTDGLTSSPSASPHYTGCRGGR